MVQKKNRREAHRGGGTGGAARAAAHGRKPATGGVGHSAARPAPAAHGGKPSLDRKATPAGTAIFFVLLVGGLLFSAYSIYSDMAATGAKPIEAMPYILLGLALLVALGFEFVNGFHDTANAVATVIYTHSLPPHFAVVWSGVWNFIGVLVSSGAVAYGIITLLPVELILQVGSSAGMSMVFSLLIAAIVWNLGTWYLGLPASSSHTLIGSIIGVGLAHQLMQGPGATSGVDWSQAAKVGWSLLLSPVIGFVAAGALLLAMKATIRNQALYKEPDGVNPPPWWIRGLLVVTCTGVSFAHGSNDGQKGMGLIMLILIGIVPTAYALNRTVAPEEIAQFRALSVVTQQSLAPYSTAPTPADPRVTLSNYISSRTYTSAVVPALVAVIDDISKTANDVNAFDKLPATAAKNMRNDMYLASQSISVMRHSGKPAFDADTKANLDALAHDFDQATKYIPLWVKVAVAIALGLGTMVGWKRIVVTVGEKIGKTHLSYAQGGAAELVAMTTIAAADMYGLPVSTTHVLSSGVAGTMAANRSGLQMRTLRNLALAWVLTLPAAIMMSGLIYYGLRNVF